jgi:hypothetical protein
MFSIGVILPNGLMKIIKFEGKKNKIKKILEGFSCQILKYSLKIAPDIYIKFQ